MGRFPCFWCATLPGRLDCGLKIKKLQDFDLLLSAKQISTSRTSPLTHSHRFPCFISQSTLRDYISPLDNLRYSRGESTSGHHHSLVSSPFSLIHVINKNRDTVCVCVCDHTQCAFVFSLVHNLIRNATVQYTVIYHGAHGVFPYRRSHACRP